MNKIAVLAKVGTLPKATQRKLIRTAHEVIADPSKRTSWLDESKGVGYCISCEDGRLIISSSERSKAPNASALTFLKSNFGEPIALFAKPSTLRPELMIFYMHWNVGQVG